MDGAKGATRDGSSESDAAITHLRRESKLHPTERESKLNLSDALVPEVLDDVEGFVHPLFLSVAANAQTWDGGAAAAGA